MNKKHLFVYGSIFLLLFSKIPGSSYGMKLADCFLLEQSDIPSFSIGQLFLTYPIGTGRMDEEDYGAMMETENAMAYEAKRENQCQADVNQMMEENQMVQEQQVAKENQIAKESQEAQKNQSQAGATNQGGSSQGDNNQGMGEAGINPGDGSMVQKVSYDRNKLMDFDYLRQNFYQIDSSTTITGAELNANELLATDVSIDKNAPGPQILIYHTHSQEGYADSDLSDPNQRVVGVGEYLTQLLTAKGYSVLHHTGEYDAGDRDHAYSNAAPALAQILAENPQIQLVIDLHRDGVPETTRLVTEQDGKTMAKVMFFNGLCKVVKGNSVYTMDNPYLKDQLALSFQMQLCGAEYYPDFNRRIYLKGYQYNMQYCRKSMLIEVGAQTNTLQEAMNAMEPLANIIDKVVSQKL